MDKTKLQTPIRWLYAITLLVSMVGMGRGASLSDIHFPLPTVGYVVSWGGNVGMSTDAGMTWNWVGQIDNAVIYSIFFTDSSTGYATGKSRFYEFHSDGHIYKTTNGGANWELIYVAAATQISGQCVLDVTFPNDSVGYALALDVHDSSNLPFSSSIIKTIDGGNSWYATGLSYSDPFYTSLSVVSADTLFIGGTTDYTVNISGIITQTTDGGVSWEKTWGYDGTSPHSGGLKAIDFVSGKFGYGGGYNILGAYRGADSLWIDTSAFGQNIISVAAIDSLVCYASGTNGTILKTINGGESWESLPSGVQDTVHSLLFVNESTGYALIGAQVLLTFDGGTSWQSVSPILAIDSSPELPSKFALHPNYPNPFNPSTTLRIDLPAAGEVSLAVYDLLGREIAPLVVGRLEAGYHNLVWGGVDSQGRAVPSGIYIARLVTPGTSESVKMVLLK